MGRYQARQMRGGNRAATRGAATSGPPRMRYARPGELPPPRFAPGRKDDVIERFDAWATRRR